MDFSISIILNQGVDNRGFTQEQVVSEIFANHGVEQRVRSITGPSGLPSAVDHDRSLNFQFTVADINLRNDIENDLRNHGMTIDIRPLPHITRR